MRTFLLSILLLILASCQRQASDSYADLRVQLQNLQAQTDASVGLIVSGFVLEIEADTPRASKKEFQTTRATGFIFTDDGLVLSCYHPFEEYLEFKAKEATLAKAVANILRVPCRVGFGNIMYIKGEPLHITPIYMSPEDDVIIFRIDKTQTADVQWAPLKCLDEEQLAETLIRGIPVYAVGFPIDANQNLSTRETIQQMTRTSAAIDISAQLTQKDIVPTMTRGVISRRYTTSDHIDVVQHDATINPGSSGGPLLDLQGRVIGMNRAKSTTSEAYNIAIPITAVYELPGLIVTITKK